MPETARPQQPEAEGEPTREVARSERDAQIPEVTAQAGPRDVLEGEVIQETREIRRLLRRQVLLLMQHRVHIGPLPPAKDYKAYEAVHSGSADRILRMAETELAHGQQMEREALAADKEIASRGQHYALIATLFLGALGAALGFAGHDWLGGAFVVSSLVPIVAHFLARRALEPKSRPRSEQPQREQPASRRRRSGDERGSLEADDVSNDGRKRRKSAKRTRPGRGAASQESGEAARDTV